MSVTSATTTSLFHHIPLPLPLTTLELTPSTLNNGGAVVGVQVHGTSLKPLNDLMSDLGDMKSEMVVHKRAYMRLHSCLTWLHKTLLGLDGHEQSWATWIGRLDLLMRHAHRKALDWTLLGPVIALANEATIKEELNALQNEAEALGIAKHSTILKSLRSLAHKEDPQDLIDLQTTLLTIASSPLYRDKVLKLRGKEAGIILDKLLIAAQGIASDPDNEADDEKSRYLSLFTALSLSILQLPRSLILMPPIADRSSKALVKGNNFELWAASSIEGKALAVKVVRPIPTLLGAENEADTFRRLAHTVFRLALPLPTALVHAHILPFLGLAPSTGATTHTFTGIVSPWMLNSSLPSFLTQHPTQDAEGRRVNRLRICAEIASAVAYLHARGIEHGNLKAENVLVDDIGRTKLTGFSYSSNHVGSVGAVGNLYSTTTLAVVKSGRARWAHPYMLQPHMQNSGGWRDRDIWSFAMLVLEVLSGERPWTGRGYVLEESVSMTLLQDSYPRGPWRGNYFMNPEWRDRGLVSDTWTLLEHCWGASRLGTVFR